MEVLTQAPQPIITCWSSIRNNSFSKSVYQTFSPAANDVSGKNLQSYSFARDINDITGSFSFTIVEDIDVPDSQELFMDKVQHLDVIGISEQGNDKYDFYGVVTDISVGAMASSLSKQVTVSGKSITYLFQYLSIYTDLQAIAFNNVEKNISLKLSLAQGSKGSEGTTIKYIAKKCYEDFTSMLRPKNGDVAEGENLSNTLVMQIIDEWFGKDADSFIVADNEKFMFPISSNMFKGGSITYIDYIKQLLPSPVYEIYGFIEQKEQSSGGTVRTESKPKLRVRKVPFSKMPFTEGTLNNKVVKINPVLVTNFTMTKSCEEVYTAFLPYIDGSILSPEFYMGLRFANDVTMKAHEYPLSISNPSKVKKYGFQVLMVSFAGYDNGYGKSLDTDGLQELTNQMKQWYSDIDEMLNGDLTIVNNISEGKDNNLNKCTIGNWLSFSGGSFYIQAESHTWNYGDNPMINFTLGRGGKYSEVGKDEDRDVLFSPLKKMSAIYKELEQ